MLDLTSLDSREDFKVELLQRAIKDADYRDRLLSRPHEILVEELGPDVAGGLTLTAHQEQFDHLYMVVNYNPKSPRDLAAMKLDKDEGVEAFLVRKSWLDPQYKKELLADPVAKIRSEFDMDLQGGLTVQAFAETPDSMHIVIPRSVLSQTAVEDRLEGELSDEELGTISGGYCSIITWVRWKLSVPSSSDASQCCSYASGVRG
ncbi:MAG: hypothetical protein HY749_01050 [Gammaproteobacteria bacterium]|nr:hypothetical protein [Gammaproteobacteria bacterium]MBI5616481.1 hypothetical protein [Gammaproteobacteria bacterium]